MTQLILLDKDSLSKGNKLTQKLMLLVVLMVQEASSLVPVSPKQECLVPVQASAPQVVLGQVLILVVMTSFPSHKLVLTPGIDLLVHRGPIQDKQVHQEAPHRDQGKALQFPGLASREEPGPEAAATSERS